MGLTRKRGLSWLPANDVLTSIACRLSDICSKINTTTNDHTRVIIPTLSIAPERNQSNTTLSNPPIDTGGERPDIPGIQHFSIYLYRHEGFIRFISTNLLSFPPLLPFHVRNCLHRLCLHCLRHLHLHLRLFRFNLLQYNKYERTVVC